MCQTLVNSVEAYFEEYHSFPIPPGTPTSPARTRLDTSPETSIIDILLGMSTVANPRSTDFLGSIPMATPVKSFMTKEITYLRGMTKIGSSYGINDPWGRPYIIEIDRAAIITGTPDPRNPNRPPARTVFVFSAGPDGNYDTLADNINSRDH